MNLNRRSTSHYAPLLAAQSTGVSFLALLLVAIFLVGGIPSIGSATEIKLTITGAVTGVLEGGWSNQPPLANDVSVGQAFTATMVFENKTPGYWYNDPQAKVTLRTSTLGIIV